MVMTPDVVVTRHAVWVGMLLYPATKGERTLAVITGAGLLVARRVRRARTHEALIPTSPQSGQVLLAWRVARQRRRPPGREHGTSDGRGQAASGAVTGSGRARPAAGRCG
jgi:hypothetical protein